MAKLDQAYIVKSMFLTKLHDKFTKPFDKYSDVLKYVLEDEAHAVYGNNVDDIAKTLVSDTNIIPDKYLNNTYRRDTSLGGNNAINCYPQFHEDDDMVYPYTAVDNGCNNGLGRVYYENIDSKQKIIYLSFGTPEFCDLTSFYSNAVDSGLSRLMNSGDNWSAANVGQFLGGVVGFALTLPLKPFIWLDKLIKGWFSTTVTKYYDFKATMPLYYSILNTAIAELAINMDLTSVEKDFQGSHTTEAESNNLFSNSNINTIDPDGKAESKVTFPGVLDLFKPGGLDILSILSKKDRFDKITAANSTSLDKEISKLQKPPTDSDFFTRFISGFASAITESKLYVGYRIEKSVSATESFSNSTKKPSIADTINSTVSSARDVKINLAHGNVLGGALGGVIGTIGSAVSGFVGGALDSVGLSGIGEMVKGNGFLDFPELWDSSSTSKSYNFTMQLRAIYGNKATIFQQLYIPLMSLLVGALPRATGRSSYTSPFLIRAHCKGLFSIPLGLIESIEITRGSEEFGWSADGYPLSIDVNFSIKDLSPAMFPSVGGNAKLLNILGQNSTWSEYLMTLGNLGIADRALFSRNIKRKTALLLKVSENVTYNLRLQGLKIGTNSTIGKILTALSPISKLPT